MNSFIYRQLLRSIMIARSQPLWQCIAFLEKSQYWNSQQMYAYQEYKLGRLLWHCYKNVPFYRSWFKKNGLSPSDIKLDKMDNLPIITKKFLQKNLEWFEAEKDMGKREQAKTSGSTGIPLHFPKSLTSTAFQLAAMYRGHRWHGVELGDREARLWGIPVDLRGRLKMRLTDLLLNRFRESEYNLNEDVLVDFYNRCLKKKPVYITGYTSMVVQFARFIEKSCLDGSRFKLKMVKCTSETIHEADYSLIERVFGCPLVSEYGAAETGLIAFQCEKGCHHIMSDCCIVEFLKPKYSLGDESLREIVVTNLDNTALPIIRYKLGDLVVPSERHCDCGRLGLVLLDKIIGRESDIIISRSGKRWHSIIIYYIMKSFEAKYGGVKHFKVVQEDLSTLKFFIVPDKNFKEDSIKYIKDKCSEYFGPEMDIKFECVKFISREKSGKLKDFVSLIHVNVSSTTTF